MSNFNANNVMNIPNFLGLKEGRAKNITIESKPKVSRSSRNISRNLSKRASSAFSTISTRFVFAPPPLDGIKPARVSPTPYFVGPIDKADLILEEVVNIRIIKPSLDDTSVPRRIRMKGKMSLGCGRIQSDLKLIHEPPEGVTRTTAVFIFDLGMVKDMKYKRKSSKDFFISFHDSDIVFNVMFKKAEDAHKWLISIFAEIRVQASAFNKILRKTINPTWTKVLKIGQLDGYVFGSTTANISNLEERELVMSDEQMDLAETCLREEVDLYTLAKGKDHPDTCESLERLAIWLKRTIRHDESNYYAAEAEKGRSNYVHRRKADMLAAENTGLQISDTMLEELKNPPGMSSMNQVATQREQNSKVDYNKRVDIILKAYDEIKKETFVFDDPDPFGALFPLRIDQDI